jgi:hypothetical protein
LVFINAANRQNLNIDREFSGADEWPSGHSWAAADLVGQFVKP